MKKTIKLYRISIIILILFTLYYNFVVADVSFCENCITVINDTGEEPFTAEDIKSIERLKTIEILEYPTIKYDEITKGYSIEMKQKEIKKDIDPLPINKVKLQNIKIDSKELITNSKYLEKYPLYEIKYCENISETICEQKLIGYFDLTKGNINYEFDINKFYKFGENSITWNAGGYILVSANSTHNTFNMSSVYYADQANGWGCFISGDTIRNQFVFNGTKCYIYIDGSSTYRTYFTDKSVQVIVDVDMANTVGGQSVFMRIGDYVTWTIGDVANVDAKAGIQGMDLKVYADGPGWRNLIGVASSWQTYIYLYSSSFTNTANAEFLNSMSAQSGRLWNNKFDSKTYISYLNNIDVNNYMVTNTPALVRRPRGTTNITNALGSYNSYAIWCQDSSGYAKNVVPTGLQYYDMILENLDADETCTLHNYELQRDMSRMQSSTENGSKAIFINDVDLLVYDDEKNLLENADVTITGANGTIYYNGLTDINGAIPTQELLYGFMVQNTSGMGNTNYNYEDNLQQQTVPYTLTLSKSGYQTYNGVIIPDKKQRLTITLQPKQLSIQSNIKTLFGFNNNRIPRIPNNYTIMSGSVGIE